MRLVVGGVRMRLVVEGGENEASWGVRMRLVGG